MNITSDLPRARDLGALRFSEFALLTNWRSIREQFGNQIAIEASRRCPSPSESLAGEAATAHLAQLISIVEALILNEHRAYGQVRWLWYIRRIPDAIFAGNLNTTLGYDRSLTENLSWYLTANDLAPTGNRVAFRADISSFRHTCRFIAGSRYLSNLHSLYRCIGKGGLLDLSKPMPTVTLTPEVETAIALYDTRHDKSQEMSFAGLGLAAANNDASALIEDPKIFSVFITMYCEPIQIPVNVPNDAGGFTKFNVLAKHAIFETSINRLLHPFGRPLPFAPPYFATIEPTLILLMILPALFNQVPWAISTTMQFGYFFVRTQWLKEVLDKWLPEISTLMTEHVNGYTFSKNYEEWRAKADSIQPSLWPLRHGGILRNYGSQTLIDVTGASNTLLHSVEIDRRASELANDRADIFELQIQEILNDSEWQPNAELKMLRGRTLRRNGEAFTDIDAIGAKGRTLLLVSCKSIIYDREYDRGDFRVIRNSQTTVDKAVTDWQAIASAIQEYPVGDNFDFSAFDTFVGIVCTPFVVYSSSEPTLNIKFESLRACVSAAELKEWTKINCPIC